MRKNQPLITLHSGVLGTEPNSLEYLKKAASLEADIIELDVSRTSDDVAVLCHDPFITANDQEYLLEENPLSFLRELKPDLVTLGEALIYSRENNLFLNLDLKTISAADALVFELKSLLHGQDIIVTGCYRDEVIYLRERIPDLRVLLNVKDEDLDRTPEHYMDGVKAIVSEASLLGCCGLNLNYRFCRPELIHYASLRSLPVMVWTIDEEEDIKQFREMGVYSITTNRIDLIHKTWKA
jgi:glycerophosphoryl diester phosphodiesterase